MGMINNEAARGFFFHPDRLRPYRHVRRIHRGAFIIPDTDSIAMAGNYMKKNKNNTVRYFNLFKQEAEYWINFFGLKGWEIFYTNKYDIDSRANINWGIIGRVAKINLSRHWEPETEQVNEELIGKAAFHEVCELFLGRLQMMAEGKICNNKHCVEEETHAIIRTLENVIYEERKKTRHKYIGQTEG